ncbi:hypothetical protein BJ878DRAFT_451822 [Calycina marina]|uniref:Cx9C motif-containing protein 4, mitochondrial n=1 Tax=Calycina marina TaxID=1763456 RepID=A0A9P7ZBH1_9HELO|nr:hypothetical protein BJ878DRAFT_451822 [Calycina marina]
MPTSVKEDIETDPPCHSRACAIQECLGKNSYDEAKCQSQISALYDCCNRFYEKNGGEASTTCCPKYGLLKLKMKQRVDSK